MFNIFDTSQALKVLNLNLPAGVFIKNIKDKVMEERAIIEFTFEIKGKEKTDTVVYNTSMPSNSTVLFDILISLAYLLVEEF